MSFSISFNKEEALDALKQQPTGMLTVSKTIDKSLKPMKRVQAHLIYLQIIDCYLVEVIKVVK